MAHLDDDKITEIRTLIHGEQEGATVPVPVEHLREFLDAWVEANRLKDVLQEFSGRNRRQMHEIRRAYLGLGDVLRASHVGPIDAYIPQEVHDLIADRRLINAIKMLRDVNPGMGLGEAKHIADRIRDNGS